MAFPDTRVPGDHDGDERDEHRGEGETSVKEPEGAVYCSDGVLSPEIDRIMKGPLDGLVLLQGIGSGEPHDGNEKFIPPFAVICLEDADVGVFTATAIHLGIPVRFIQSKIRPNSKPHEYFHTLSLLVDLVIFYAQKKRGVRSFAKPISLASTELHAKAEEVVRITPQTDEWVSEVQNFALQLHEKLAVSQG